MSRLTYDRNQKVLLELVSKPGNDICADCKARNPRWASYNLGIFICVGCASIHRKMGTHITKVKSLTMDSWTKEQVERMRDIGNTKSNTLYNPNEARHPPPANLMDAERDSELETYLRSKYEFKRFLEKYGASKLGASQSASSVSSGGSTRSVSTPLSGFASSSTSRNSTADRPSQNRPSAVPAVAATPSRVVSQPVLPTQTVPQPQPRANPPSAPANNAPVQPAGVWADLVSLQAPTQNSSLPLQIQVPPPSQSLSSQLTSFPSGFGTGVGMQQQQPLMGLQQQAFSAGPMAMSFAPATPSFVTQPTYLSQQAPAAPQPRFIQPQPYQACLQFPNGVQQPGFATGSPGPFLSSSPAIPLMASTTPQPTMISTTPQPPMIQPQVQLTQFGSANAQMSMQGPSLAMGMGPGMSMGVGMRGQPQYLSTTPQPTMQQQGYFMPQHPQMMPGSQLGGFQTPMQSQSFATGAFAAGAGQQWGPL